MLKLFLVALVLVGLAVAGIAIKMFIQKDGQFKKQCGSVDPTTGKHVECTCKSMPQEQCDNS